MTTFNILGIRPDGKLSVRSTDSAIDGAVAAPSLSGPYFDNDETVETSEGTATKSGSSWQLVQEVDTDSGECMSGTVLYNARWLGLPSWAPRHDPAKPKKVQLGTVEVTYNEDGTPTVEGTDGSFTGGGRTWNLAEITGDKSAFIRAKADHDWEQRTPFPPKAQHTPNVQYVGAPNVLLNRDPALTSYFGRPEARRLSDGTYEEKSPRFNWLKATWTEGELELRDRDGVVTDEQQGEWGNATVSWTENVADVSAGEGSVDEAAVGVKQRLRIRVPNVYTQMTLGEAVRNRDSDGLGCPGFGVVTEGHVFISAQNDDGANSHLRLQSTGNMSLQTPSMLALGGGNAAVLSSAASTVVTGGAGVMIHGGISAPWAANQTPDDVGPDTPPWLSALNDRANNFGTAMSVVDAAVAAYCTYQSAKDMKKGWAESAKIAKIAGVVSSTLGAVAGAVSAANAGIAGFNAAFSTQANSFGGTTVFGTSGLILGSGMTAGFYSTMGTTIASPASVTILSGLSSALTSKISTEVAGKITTIRGDSELHLGGDQVAISAAKKPLGLYGVKILIGKDAGGLPKPLNDGGPTLDQSGTVDVEVRASSTVTLRSQDKASLQGDKEVHLTSAAKAAVDAPVVNIQGTSEVAVFGANMASMTSNKEVKLGVKKAKVNLTPSSVVIGVGGAPLPAAPSKHLAGQAKNESNEDFQARRKAHFDAQKAYHDKVKAAKEAKEVFAVFENGKIEFQVKGLKMTLDSGKGKMANSLIWQK